MTRVDGGRGVKNINNPKSISPSLAVGVMCTADAAAPTLPFLPLPLALAGLLPWGARGSMGYVPPQLIPSLSPPSGPLPCGAPCRHVAQRAMAVRRGCDGSLDRLPPRYARQLCHPRGVPAGHGHPRHSADVAAGARAHAGLRDHRWVSGKAGGYILAVYFSGRILDRGRDRGWM